MQLRTISSALVMGRRKFSFIFGTRSIDPIDYLLCNQIEVHFSDDDTNKANGLKFIRTDFYRSIIRFDDIRKYSSSECIWKYFPLEWRDWWFDDIIFQFSTYYLSW